MNGWRRPQGLLSTINIALLSQGKCAATGCDDDFIVMMMMMMMMMMMTVPSDDGSPGRSDH